LPHCAGTRIYCAAAIESSMFNAVLVRCFAEMILFGFLFGGFWR
jgi:hypothetical protein